MARNISLIAVVFVAMLGLPDRAPAQEPTVDLSAFEARGGCAVRRTGDELQLSWPADRATGYLAVDLLAGRPILKSMGLVTDDGKGARALVENADISTFLLVGSRTAPADRPPSMSLFNVFFDTPAKRPFDSFLGRLDRKRIRVVTRGRQTTVSIAEVAIGPFTGELRLTVYSGASLVHVETVVHTTAERRAILYDAGLAFEPSPKMQFAWVGADGSLKRHVPAPSDADRSVAVRHRALIAELESGSVVCFPPPHQFFFPRDLTDNVKTVWFGRGHRGLDTRFGFGIRQAEEGGGVYVPWFNAPPGTEQRLGAFFLLSPGDAKQALGEALRYTRDDRYAKLPGFHTYTSHWHMALTMAAIEEKKRGGPRTLPDAVRMFADMGVEILHLAEFHGDGHPQDAGPIRLRELEAMNAECRRLSEQGVLFLPGEEANISIGEAKAGREAGHWMYLFPRPVYWTMKRTAGQPFSEDDPRLGRIYHVGDGADMMRLLNQEKGLAWSSHARIKGSSWTPDIFRDRPFYKSDRWLGAAWKAMPADLSHEILGKRALDLLDDMSNWGARKYLPGEVDVFKIDHTHELFGHMNINYIQLDLDRVPRFDESWQPVLDSLRNGRLFVTTGEVLVPEFTVNGKPSGSTIAPKLGETVEVRARLSWTFPLRYVELISGDGARVYRDRIDMSDTGPFQERHISHKIDLTGKTWIRLEAADIATNTAFTQPVWLSPSSR